jgi:hypothetical protein
MNNRIHVANYKITELLYVYVLFYLISIMALFLTFLSCFVEGHT